MRGRINFDERPILVFWEVTRACKLVCRHCRAMAIEKPLPGEMDRGESTRLIDEITRFGRPYPVIIFTGGDPLMRPDIFDLISYSRERGIPVAMAPAISDMLSSKVIDKLSQLGVSSLSISIDGSKPEVHDFIRGVPGHLEESLSRIRDLMDHGMKVQVNTAVMRYNVYDLPNIVKLLLDLDISVWEVFFLIHVGRGSDIMDITPPEYEDVLNFLYEVSKYDIIVRTVEAPFFRRIVLWRRDEHRDLRLGSLYRYLNGSLRQLVGEPSAESRAQTLETRDGKGIIFVAYNGDVYPSGFAPFTVGNVRNESIVKIYRDNRVLRLIRKGEFSGRCGICEYKDICGGSRARALSVNNDILAEDPACIYIPRRS